MVAKLVLKYYSAINIIVLCMPVFLVAYFLRLPGLSFYIFDAYFFVLGGLIVYLLGVRIKGAEIFVALLVFLFSSSVGFQLTVLDAFEFDVAGFLAATFRYTQFVLLIIILNHASSTIEERSVEAGRVILLAALSMPLVFAFLGVFLVGWDVFTYGRLSGYFGNPNYLTAYITIVIPVFNVFVREFQVLSRVGLTVLFYGLVIFCLVYAGSNSGWLLSGVSLLLSLYTLRTFGFRNCFIFGAIVLLCVVYFADITSWMVDSDIRGVNKTGQLLERVHYGERIRTLGSGELRDELLQDSLGLYLSKASIAMFGVGLGQSPLYLERLDGHRVTVHNTFIVLLIEAGFFGMIGFVLVIVYSLFLYGLDRLKVGLLFGYMLSMLATPHVYMPFLWGITVYGWFYINVQGRRESCAATEALS